MKKNVSRLYSSFSLLLAIERGKKKRKEKVPLSVVMIHLKIESMGPEARRSTPFSLENLRSLSVCDDDDEDEDDEDDRGEAGVREVGEEGGVSSKGKETEGAETRGEATCGREVEVMEAANEAAGESKDEKDLEKTGDAARVRYFGPG